ncbi:MAG: ATP-binding cassette domain-containing protein, partial [Clostridia bacterium]|nr:ATP-binding cassette domain-containing protein [Clostridia bacterium]
LLLIASGLLKPDGGDVEYRGKIGVSFAEPRLFGNADVLSNVTCVMDGKGSQKTERAKKILISLGLGDALGLYPRDLSTGMAARVSLARLIAYDPDIYLMDEPFSALDEATKSDVIRCVSEYTRGKSVMLITHDSDEARMMNAVIVTLSDGIIR